MKFFMQTEDNWFETYQTGFWFEGQRPIPYVELEGFGAQNKLLLDYGHVANQIKGKEAA